MTTNLNDDAAERHLLSSCIYWPETCATVRHLLKSADFFDRRHGLVWGAICRCSDALEIFDPWTLHEETAVDFIYIMDMQGVAGTNQKAHVMAGRIAAAAVMRRRVSSLHALIADANTDAPDDWMQKLAALDTAPSQTVAPVAGESIGDIAYRAWQRYLDPHAKPVFVPTGIDWLDTLTGGGYAKAMHVIAARPAQGKTALATQIAMSIARQNIGQVLFFCVEMNNDSQYPRLAAQAGISSHGITKHRLNTQDQDAFRIFVEECVDLRDTMRLYDDMHHVEDICREVRARHEQAPVALIVVDYYQNLQTRQRFNTRLDQLVHISQELMRLARSLDTPLILLAQIKREVETAKRKPMMADLSDCSQLEKDAHTILFPYLPAAMQQSEDPGEATMILAKNRGGLPGQTAPGGVRWHGASMRYLKGMV